MKTITVLVFMLSLLVTAGAQPNPDTLWTHTFGGSGYDWAYSIQQTSDGGFIVAGVTGSFGAGGHDFYLVKTNSLGDTLWTRTYGGTNDDWAYFIQQTSDGGYIVAGYTHSRGAGLADFYLVKTNSQGDTLWTRTYGGSASDGAWSVRQTADGGYVLAGTTFSFGAGNYDLYLVKTNSLGDTVWTRTYGGGSRDEALFVLQTTDRGYIVAGYAESFGAGLYDFYLVKTDSLGDTLWTRTYGGSSWEYGYSVQQTTDAGYIIAGYTYSLSAASNDLYLVKTNSQGGLLWTRTFGGNTWDEAQSVQQTSDGGYIMAGYTESFGAGSRDFYLVKTGPDQLDSEPICLSAPSQYMLYPNFPNPFNPSTRISYALPKAAHVRLTVFNLLGEQIATLADGIQPTGIHTLSFDGSALASGVYLYLLQSEGFSQARKMVLLK
ncbi:T9SS type A sorting domain-containing protein [bacterium]|nr:T9SS type A sorting domain-containing protein [bacterium]